VWLRRRIHRNWCGIFYASLSEAVEKYFGKFSRGGRQEMSMKNNENTKRNKKAKALVKALLDSTNYSLQDIYSKAGLDKEIKLFSSFQTWLSQADKTTAVSNLDRIEKFYEEIERDVIPAAIKKQPHAFYFAFVKKMRIRDGNRHFLGDFLPGIYRVYKGSFFLPQNIAGIIVGYMRIFSEGLALRVEEFQQYDGRYGSQPLTEEQTGYAFFKSNKVYMFTTEKDKPEHMHITTLDQSVRDSEKVRHMRGVTFGTSLHLGTFNSRVVMERVDDDSDENAFARHKMKSHIRLVRDIEKRINESGYTNDAENPGDFFLEFIRQQKVRDDVVTIW
jgi:hypothetical protein